MVTLSDLNAGDRGAFVEALGWVFEQSPWVAERAWKNRPFGSVDELIQALVAVVNEAHRDEQLALLRAHPDLGTRAKISNASTAEQSGAGLDRLTPDEFDRLQRLNDDYRRRFGFPFLFAVKGRTKHEVLQALGRRVAADPVAEFSEALRQVYRIAEFRLHDLIM
jgi:OHCU decarboxylase